VDSVITAGKNLIEAKNFYTESKALFVSASMNLREWGTNSRKFAKFIAEN